MSYLQVMVHERSVVNSMERSKSSPITIRVSANPAHNYSTQTLNTTEQGNEALRNMLAEVSCHIIQYLLFICVMIIN